MKLIYGTGNQGKVNQVRDYLKTTDLNLEIISIKDLGFNEDVEENGKTFEENSLIKAKAMKKFLDENKIEGIIMTDDSGLCVNALGGKPGIYSARYAGDHAPHDVVLNKLLEEIEKTKTEDRSAQFVCVLTAILPSGKVIVARGEDNGKILKKPGTMGKLTYDPVFVPEGFEVPMTEIADKDLGSTHREKALLKLIEKLKDEDIN